MQYLIFIYFEYKEAISSVMFVISGYLNGQITLICIKYANEFKNFDEILTSPIRKSEYGAILHFHVI